MPRNTGNTAGCKRLESHSVYFTPGTRLTADRTSFLESTGEFPFAAQAVCEECASADNRGVVPSVTISAFIRTNPEALVPDCPSLDRNLRLDRQTLCGLTGANGLIATTPEPNAENRGAVCS